MALSAHLTLKNSLKLSPNIEQSVTLLKSNEIEIELLIYDFLSKNPYLHLDDSEKINLNYSARSIESNEENISEKSIYGLSLKDYLLNNLFDLGLDYEDELLARLIVDYIDDNGYLTKDYEFFITELGLDTIQANKKIESIILKLNNISSPGIGARNLQECLKLQLDQFIQNQIVLHSKKIIENHLVELANKNFKKIAKDFKCSVNHILECNEFIVSLNPKPGLAYLSSDTSQFITPDIIIKNNGNEFNISLQNNYESLKLFNLKKEEINDKEAYNQAKWFIKNLNYRKINIIRVVNFIFTHHKDFLKGNILKSPLNIKTVANELQIHESTVSRIVNNKFVETPHGIFDLKYFFLNKVNNNSNKTILDKIRTIIKNEDKFKPFSDSEIHLTLGKENITISRRTIAKYREQLGILPASKRKKGA
ncbi:MAG: RNA polymerase sigma-54 factor [Betaproteobacteria bacterium]|nr:RNA polymerase sigma-54 factor [Betaproteobacteria bacterium]